MIYEFITPSDPITFKAENDKIACACAVILGNGKAGCERVEPKSDDVIPSMLFFDPDATDTLTKYLGIELKEFVDANRHAVAQCFKSFAYGSLNNRKTFDDACEAITDEQELREFRRKHDDRNRSSISKWVLSAWRMGDNILTKIDQK